jgi:hypothetical protein
MRSVALAGMVMLELARPAGATDRKALAVDLDEQFHLGEQAWKASCPQPTEDGRCVEVREIGHRRQIVVIDRDRKLAAEARQHFVAAAKLWRRLRGGEILGAREDIQPDGAPSRHLGYAPIFSVDPDKDRWESTSGVAAASAPTGDAGAARAAAGTAFYLAEAELERFLRIDRPFDPAVLARDPASHGPNDNRHRRRLFERFILRKLDQLARTRRMYLAVFVMHQAPFEVASAARIGQLYDTLDNDLWVNQHDPPEDPLDRKAVAAFEKCFDIAAKDARYDGWFRLCDHELTILRPHDFPRANELVPEADHAAARLVLTPPVPRLE